MVIAELREILQRIQGVLDELDRLAVEEDAAAAGLASEKLFALAEQRAALQAELHAAQESLAHLRAAIDAPSLRDYLARHPEGEPIEALRAAIEARLRARQLDDAARLGRWQAWIEIGRWLTDAMTEHTAIAGYGPRGAR